MLDDKGKNGPIKIPGAGALQSILHEKAPAGHELPHEKAPAEHELKQGLGIGSGISAHGRSMLTSTYPFLFQGSSSSVTTLSSAYTFRRNSGLLCLPSRRNSPVQVQNQLQSAPYIFI